MTALVSPVWCSPRWMATREAAPRSRSTASRRSRSNYVGLVRKIDALDEFHPSAWPVAFSNG